MSNLVRLCRRAPAMLALPAAVTMAVALLSVAGRAWYLTGDYAHTELLVRAIPRHPPLVGVAARVVDDGATPGPSMAYLLAPGYRLFGSDAWALVASLAVLHAAALVATVVVARRHGGLPLAACVALALATMTAGFAPQFFLEPWNVWVPVYAYALFLMLVWAVAQGRLALAPLAVAVGSHCVQSHVSYTLLVGGLLFALATWLAWARRRTDLLEHAHMARWMLVAAGTGVVVWLPPLIDELRPGAGNLHKLFRQFTDPGEPYVGFGAAAKAMASRFNLLGSWFADPWRDPRATPNFAGFVAFAALAATGVALAWRRRERAELTLYAVLGTSTVLGLVSTMRVFGVFFAYVIRWMSPLAALWVAAALWSVVRTVASAPVRTVPRWRDRAHPAPMVAGLLAFGLAGASLVGVVRASGGQIPSQRDSDTTGALVAQLSPTLDPASRYQVNEADAVALGGVAFGLVLELERRGFHAGPGPWGAAGVMPHRVVADAEADATLWLITTHPAIVTFADTAGVVQLAYYDPRSDAALARSEELERELLARLCAIGGEPMALLLFQRWGHTVLNFFYHLPRETAELLYEYGSLGQPAAVFSAPVGTSAYDMVLALPTPCPGP